MSVTEFGIIFVNLISISSKLIFVDLVIECLVSDVVYRWKLVNCTLLSLAQAEFKATDNKNNSGEA